MTKPLVRDRLLADRIRAAACIVLAKNIAPMKISELVDAIGNIGIPIPAPANKTLADLLRCEVNRGHIRHTGWGEYKIGDLPPGTRYSMRRRVNSYLAGRTTQPNNWHGLSDAEMRSVQHARAVTHPHVL